MIVASFFAPREVRWGLDSVGYHRCLRVLDDSCKRLGLRHVVLSDSERAGFETAIYPLPENLMQAFLSAQMQLLETAKEPILLTGADCILTADPRDVVGEHDMAITVGPFRDCRMNTGAIFIKDGPKVAHVWRKALESNPTAWGDDQRALYRAILASGLNVLELPCERYNWAPESPDDPAGMPMVAHFRGNRKGWMRQWYERFVINPPDPSRLHVRRCANTSIDTMMEHMQANIGRDVAHFERHRKRREPLCIVGGSPSLRDHLSDIRRRKANGAAVWALNNAWRVLAEAKIAPDAIVIMDCRPENIAFVENGPDCEYLLASCVHPSLFDALKGWRVTMWHSGQPGRPERAILKDIPHVIVPGGGTVGLRALMMGPLRGYVTMHLYGMDSSYRDDQHHAYPQSLNDSDAVYVLEHTKLTRKYRVASWMVRQADEFLKFRAELQPVGVRIFAHGDGLIPDLSRYLHRSEQHERAADIQDGRRRAHRAEMGRGGESRRIEARGAADP